MYDIIGDIHGHAHELEILLQKLGYQKQHGIYSHPLKRQVIFVGDFIDRGPQIRETLQLVRAMCEDGSALAVMGNHEYNAICYHTPNAIRGGYFRDHSEKNTQQHRQTLEQFKGYENEWTGYLEWFKTLLLFLDLEHIRVVHACWDEPHIEWLKLNYDGLSTEFLDHATDELTHSDIYTIVEETLKGKEFDLPDGTFFQDKDGNQRNACRLKWWAHGNQRTIYNDIFLHSPDNFKNDSISSMESYHQYDEPKPVFFGHYWLQTNPIIENENAICLDYSVAKGGILVACRVNFDNGVLEKQLIR